MESVNNEAISIINQVNEIKELRKTLLAIIIRYLFGEALRKLTFKNPLGFDKSLAELNKK